MRYGAALCSQNLTNLTDFFANPFILDPVIILDKRRNFLQSAWGEILDGKFAEGTAFFFQIPSLVVWVRLRGGGGFYREALIEIKRGCLQNLGKTQEHVDFQVFVASFEGKNDIPFFAGPGYVSQRARWCRRGDQREETFEQRLWVQVQFLAPLPDACADVLGHDFFDGGAAWFPFSVLYFAPFPVLFIARSPGFVGFICHIAVAACRGVAGSFGCVVRRRGGLGPKGPRCRIRIRIR